MNHLQRVLSPTDTDSSHGGCRSDADSDAILDILQNLNTETEISEDDSMKS